MLPALRNYCAAHPSKSTDAQLLAPLGRKDIVGENAGLAMAALVKGRNRQSAKERKV
jgi:hypothetical protein